MDERDAEVLVKTKRGKYSQPKMRQMNRLPLTKAQTAYNSKTGRISMSLVRPDTAKSNHTQPKGM
jgi:hypothetical protein